MTKGQVVVEALVGLTLLLLAVLMLSEHLLPAASGNQQQLVDNRSAIWSRQADLSQLQVSDDYASAKYTGKLLNGLSQLVELDFEVDNLHRTTSEGTEVANIYPMARITDSWSAQTESALSKRPALLVVNSLLSNGLVKLIQDGIGWLPIAREVHSSSLKFGHIDSDVVPPMALKN
ncbi:MAG: hypothetical protein ACQEQ8_01530 [Pseudomonadota bacterium]